MMQCVGGDWFDAMASAFASAFVLLCWCLCPCLSSDVCVVRMRGTCACGYDVCVRKCSRVCVRARVHVSTSEIHTKTLAHFSA